MEIPGDTIGTGTILTNTLLAGYVLEERLDDLRQSRVLLGLLRDDVDCAAGRLAAGDLTGSWRSETQRGYDRQRSDLAGELRRAAGLLDTALIEVAAAIDRVGAALAETLTPGREPGAAPGPGPDRVPR